ncbi:MAG TPA: hypothetical protein VHP14_08055, partial [Anaerolineales bacterium]|nr:hypothetical protein [Anaerolineales bacterium]
MRTKMLGFILLIILTGCVTTPTAFDPNLYAARSQMTAQAANNEAQLFGLMATGTAQAPIIHITETAAAKSVIWTQSSVDSTSTAVQWTSTPSPVPTITPSPTPNATTTLSFAFVQGTQTQVVLKGDRDQMTNTAHAFVWYALAVACLIAGFSYAFVHIKRLSFVVIPTNEQGRSQPMLNVIDATATDIERAANGAAGVNRKFLKQLPMITPERQDLVTARSQMVD